MNSGQFRGWRLHMDMSQAEAALGLAKGSVELYELGRRRNDGRPVVIPKTVELACAALALGIKAYDGPAG